ncbi:MAG: energy-coupling factor ABC transporter substrate-binding protein [Archaeoglobaceae archaeon]
MIKFLSLFDWVGTDEIAQEVVAEINPDYKPWFNPVFEPSGEIETLLFCIQVAIGALILGYILGSLRHGRSREDSNKR